ncbi:unnamed protein product [Amoebophrya sp. A25]|nr:unnamed protein product [Amoebophrya sp. A25]|eukprot:GSA25T00021219001.1
MGPTSISTTSHLAHENNPKIDVELPIHLMCEILSYLPLKELMNNVSYVAKRYRNLAEHVAATKNRSEEVILAWTVNHELALFGPDLTLMETLPFEYLTGNFAFASATVVGNRVFLALPERPSPVVVSLHRVWGSAKILMKIEQNYKQVEENTETVCIGTSSTGSFGVSYVAEGNAVISLEHDETGKTFLKKYDLVS